MTSYLPFVEALQGALGLKEPGRRQALLSRNSSRASARSSSSLEPFIPLYLHLLSMPSDVFPVPRHLRGEHLQAAMLEALAAFFTSHAQRAPGLLLLEDWHWADDASRARAAALGGSGRRVSAAHRGDDQAGAGRVRSTRSEQTLRINLAPLEFAASLSIVKSVLGVERVPDELARRLHERTGGNPFFLEEMCHGLREAGVVTPVGSEAIVSGSTDALQLPDSVQAVIRSRLDRMTPDGREVLRVASVIGREFARRILRDAWRAATDLAPPSNG